VADPTERRPDNSPGPVRDRRDSGLVATRRGQGRPALYTAEEAAAILRVKKSWLQRQAAKRKIPFTMLGGSYRFTSAHLAEIVLIHEEPPAPGNDTPAHSTTRRIGPQGAYGLGVTPLRPRPSGGPHRAA
jgi:excisionase family DNA binding protein